MRMRLFHCTLHGEGGVTVEEHSLNYFPDVVRAFFMALAFEVKDGIFYTKEFRSSNKVTWVAVVTPRFDHDLLPKVRSALEDAKEIVFDAVDL